MEKCVFEHGEYCEALTCKECKGCSFRKTEEELNKGRRKVLCRLYMLPASKKRYISSKYHKGKRLFSGA